MIEMFQQRQWELEYADLGRIPRARTACCSSCGKSFGRQRNFPTESVKTMHLSKNRFHKFVRFLLGYAPRCSSSLMAQGLRPFYSV